MIIEKFASLPPWIMYEGIHFELQLIVNGPDDVRLCYQMLYVEKGSPSNGNRPRYFLYLHQNITTDEGLLEAIALCHKFLKNKKLAL